MNQLRGSLIIDGLKNMKSCESESKNVNLLAKEHLQEREAYSMGAKKNICEFEMLLEKLQPHSNL